MECIFVPELNESSNEIIISNERINHLKALRLQTNDQIIFTNGKGLCSVCILLSNTKIKYHFKVKTFLKNHGELPYKLGIALGILSDRNRMEFALEKAVEMGATDFYPIITRYSEKRKINFSRLQSKSIAAMEQSKRSCLIHVHQPVCLNDFENIVPDYDTIILAEETGNSPEMTKSLKSTICFVGPEGGFDSDEIEFLKGLGNSKCWNLGNRRLRTETAASAILTLVSMKQNQ
ncbi:MAG: RsmE family RNA methyltransferase [bacterium]